MYLDNLYVISHVYTCIQIISFDIVHFNFHVIRFFKFLVIYSTDKLTLIIQVVTMSTDVKDSSTLPSIYRFS